MEENTQLPKEVVERILKARDALVVGDRDEAYHQLYGIASPKFDKYYPWGEMEKQVGHIRLNEQDIINSKEVTAYATKLHQANEVIKVLEYDNNKLKGEVEGLRSAGDEASGYIEFLDVQNNRLRKMLSDICEKAGAGTEIEKMIVEFFKDINTERESAAGREDWISVDERLPDESGRYWCYMKDINDLGTSYFQWNCAYNANEKRFSDSTLFNGEQVTHWRPLPEPPKRKQQKEK